MLDTILGAMIGVALASDGITVKAVDLHEKARIDKVLEIADHIVERCAEPVIFEELLKRLFDDYGLTLTFEQYALVGSTVKSYLAWLKDTGRLTVLFEDNRLLWRRV